jgi:hypothetical protein
MNDPRRLRRPLRMRWRLALCRLRGHRPLLHLAAGHIWLRCVECAYETEGWTWPPAAREPRWKRYLRFVQRLRAD